jgi:hypothetical protein
LGTAILTPILGPLMERGLLQSLEMSRCSASARARQPTNAQSYLRVLIPETRPLLTKWCEGYRSRFHPCNALDVSG